MKNPAYLNINFVSLKNNLLIIKHIFKFSQFITCNILVLYI